MEGLGGHAHECHDLQELLLTRLAQLLHIIPSLLDEGLVVGKKIGALQDSVQLQLPQCPRQCHGSGTRPEKEVHQRKRGAISASPPAGYQPTLNCLLPACFSSFSFECSLFSAQAPGRL